MGANVSTSATGPSSGSNTGVTVHKVKNNKHEFRVHVPPHQLEGIEIIW